MSSNKDDEPMKMILVNKLDPMSEFIPFGKYLLSLKNLQKNKFMLRTKSKNPVLSFKTLTLTRKTKAIVQNLLRQNPISFEDIDALNEEEKEQIDTIVSKTEITDRLKIPNTKRSRLEKDLNKFNVLRGSIIAGGDNIEMLRDFRKLLLSLSNSGYISKKETGEVLLEMLKLNI